ncbi:MAG: hypothetical protein FWE08_07315 [Oscillospiraceae bacterium]|nr:hypothetical protein [Oscillospiraceae bacterium]
MDYETPGGGAVPPNNYKGMAIASLVLGIVALVVPIPVLDVIAGVVGLFLAGISMKHKAGGLAVAGLVLSILGTIAAIQFTLQFYGVIPSPWDSFDVWF